MTVYHLYVQRSHLLFRHLNVHNLIFICRLSFPSFIRLLSSFLFLDLLSRPFYLLVPFSFFYTLLPLSSLLSSNLGKYQIIPLH